MIEVFRAIILGIVQGLTEFLPVSSSGHLEIAKYILGNELAGDESLMMTILFHVATALSTMFVFRKDILEILKGLCNTKMNEEKKFSLAIILSMIPAVIVGLFFLDELERLFTANLLLVGCMLIVTGVLLFLADRAKETDKNVSYTNAFIVGLAQAVATIPGISRSGATIASSVLLGIDRQKAARFSFLMVIPLILGKVIQDLASGEYMDAELKMLPMLFGFAAAFFTGIFACKWMIALVQKSKLSYFSYYCFAVGIIAIIFGLWL